MQVDVRNDGSYSARELGLTPWNAGLASTCLIAFVLVLSTANAQEASKHDGDAASTTVLQPIKVTSPKTEETLQDLALSVTVVKTDRLAASPADPGTGIATAPNVQWQNGSVGRQSFSIRGVGSLGGPLNYSDGTVGFNVDGIPNSMMTASSPLLDVDHVEVLRGPQGTLWGANSLGGAINVTTNQPNSKREIKFTTEIGDNGYRMGEFILGGNIVPDSVDGRVAVRFTNLDGDISSLHTDNLDARRISAARGGLRFTGIEDTTVTLAGSYFSDKNTMPFYVLGGTSGFPLSGELTAPEAVSSHGDGAITIIHDFDNFDLTSITSIQHSKIDSYLDNTDSLIFPGFPSNPGKLVDRENIYSQEIRLNSLAGDPLRWVVGGSANYSDLHRDCWATNCAPSNKVKQMDDLKSLNLGLFGDVSIPVEETWELSAGGRVSQDHIRMRKRTTYGNPLLDGEGSADDTYLTGRASISHKLSESALTYISIARGHSSAVFPLFGYPTTGVLDPAYPASTGWTYEAGGKATFFDDMVQLEGSAFYNSIKNGTVFFLDPKAFALTSTYQDYDTIGFELQAKAEIAADWTITTSLGYAYSKLGRSGANAGTEGNRVPNIPDWSGSIALEYYVPTAFLNLDGDVTTSIEYQYNSQRAADVADTFNLPAYSLVNARVGWKNTNDDFELYGFARNLFNERYEMSGAAGFAPNDQYLAVGRGRIVGLGMSKSF